MAYTINRKAHVIDEIKLEDNGKELTVKVDLQVERILKDYNAAWTEIGKAQRRVQELREGDGEGMDDAMAATGAAIMALFRLLFGADQTRAIVDWYGGAYLEMLGDFVPYISETIVPKVKAAQESLLQRYSSWNR